MPEARECEVRECTKSPRSRTATLCPMHYHRQYRHGDVNATARAGFTVQGPRRYRRVAANGHPLSGADGRAYAHRIALYSTIGPGEHPCHWCGKAVTWDRSVGESALVADHLNNDTSDNSTGNLVPSCARCNGARGLTRRHEAIRRAGFWSGADTVARSEGRALIGSSEARQ
jgi:hypothetical protein